MSKKAIEPKSNDKRCDGCGTVQHFWNIIDDWAIIDGKYYCRSCQKRMGIGWYEKKKT